MTVCPNCMGRNSSYWPFGPCTVCKGTGKTTKAVADKIREKQRNERSKTP